MSYSDLEKTEEEEGEETSEDTNEEEEEEEKEEGEEDMEEAEKSLSVPDLMKAVEAYETVETALGKSGTNREDFLRARLDSGLISKSERAELGKIWFADESDAIDADRISKSVSEQVCDDGNNDLMDASGFLKSLVDGVDLRMDRVEGEILRDGLATRELMKAQSTILKGVAGVISEQDRLIKGLINRIEHVESTPQSRRAVSTPSGSTVIRGLSKSVIGESSYDDLSKSDVNNGLRRLMVRASDSNDEAAMDRIVQATALYEQTGNIPQNVMQAIERIASS